MRGLNALQAGFHTVCFGCNLSHLLANLVSANLFVYSVTLHASDKINLRKNKNFKKWLIVSEMEVMPIMPCSTLYDGLNPYQGIGRTVPASGSQQR